MDTLNHLDLEYGQALVESAMELADEGKLIDQELQRRGLRPMTERTHVFTVYSPESRKAIAIAVTPYVTEDQSREGGLSISEGGFAQGAIVYMERRTRLSRFETLAVEDGRVRVDAFDAGQLNDRGPRALAMDAGKIKARKPLVEITPRQARGIGSQAFTALLADETSRSVHPPAEITALRGNTKMVSDIANFILNRTSGSACCSCSCSCWGSSSCSCSYVG